MTKHIYTLEFQSGHWKVFISPTTSYGYYEHEELGEGGGLWFEGSELVDFDGRYFVPKNVALCIEKMGYSIDRAVFCS